jgi:hypothetical protein
MSGGDLKYLRTEKVGEHYFIFVEDITWNPGMIYLIVLDNTGNKLSYIANMPYGIGSTTLK